MVQFFDPLPPMWTTQMRLLASGFGLTQSWLFGHLLSKTAACYLSPFFSLPLFLCFPLSPYNSDSKNKWLYNICKRIDIIHFITHDTYHIHYNIFNIVLCLSVCPQERLLYYLNR